MIDETMIHEVKRAIYNRHAGSNQDYLDTLKVIKEELERLMTNVEGFIREDDD